MKKKPNQGNLAPLSEPLLVWLEANSYKPDDLNFQGGHGNTALMKAAREGREAWVVELLAHGADVERMNIDGNTALWLACFSDDVGCVQRLIDAGIKLDTQNVNGVTPLMYAASSGKEAIVKLLIENGADKTLANDDDFTALDLACTRTIVKLLR